MKIGLFFGSFNPIHTGHLIIANFILENSDLERIWFVVSPHNPLKEKKSLLNQYDRLHLVNLAIEDNPKFKASDIEFKLPQPSYTIDTLAYLAEKFSQHQFGLIMGSDNLSTINKWKKFRTVAGALSHLLLPTRRYHQVGFPQLPECSFYGYADD